MKKLIALAFGCMVFASFGALGANDAAVVGAGATSCAQFAKNYEANPDHAELAFFSWAQGFMSSLNMAAIASKHPYKDLNTDVESQKLHVRGYCNVHPLANFLEAAMDLYSNLHSPISN